MKAHRKFGISIAIALVVMLSGFALLPLAMTTQAFSDALPWDIYANAYMSRCYVNDDAAGVGNGNSWQDAYVDLQSALGDLSCLDIWVAEGTYKPGTARTDTFTLRNGVALYGGFAGTETHIDQRPWNTHPSILSGDIRSVQHPNDYSYHVVTATDIGTTAIMNGFSISNGRADRIGTIDVSGGGMLSTRSWVQLLGITFEDNYAFSGAGLKNDSGDVTLINVTFRRNTATQNGGGMENVTGRVRMVSVVFFDNEATNGGGIYINGSEQGKYAVLTNPTFIGNHAAAQGGGVYTTSSSLELNNAILWGNTATNAGAQVYSDSGYTNITYGLVEGGCPNGMGCSSLLTTNPQFADMEGGNFHLLTDSPAIDYGDKNAAFLHMSIDDLDGNPRIVGENVDLGAYEFQGRCYVKGDAAGANTGLNWSDAFVHLSSAMPFTACDEIWVAEGTYKPILKPTDTDRTASFGLRYGMAVYGGFEGTETQLAERDWKAHPTILSGEIGGEKNPADNSYHVVTALNTDPAATMDGFTITGGHADEPGASAVGGGVKSIASILHLDNITFEDNYASSGGGLNSSAGSTDLNNVTFLRNTAIHNGGGMNISGGRAWMVSSTFIANSATQDGGGMNVSSADTWMVNAVFSRNTAALGGGVAVSTVLGGDEVILVNGTFSGNSATVNGGGLYGSGTAVNLQNTILWGNTATGNGPDIFSATMVKPIVSYSLIKGGCQVAWFTCGTNILISDPRLVNASQDNLHLFAASPAINAGNHEALFLLVTTDMDGNPRIIGSEVDLGPYEYQPKVYVPVILR